MLNAIIFIVNLEFTKLT